MDESKEGKESLYLISDIQARLARLGELRQQDIGHTVDIMQISETLNHIKHEIKWDEWDDKHDAK